MDFLNFFEGCDPEEIKTEELLLNDEKPFEKKVNPNIMGDDDFSSTKVNDADFDYDLDDIGGDADNDEYDVDDDDDEDYGVDVDDLEDIDLDDLKGALDVVGDDEDALEVIDDMDDDDLASADIDDPVELEEDPAIEPLVQNVPEEELSAEEKKAASDMIAASVPSMLVKTELDAMESAEFFTSADASIAIDEGLMESAYVDEKLLELSRTASLVEEAGMPTSNKTIVRFSKQALINRIHGICIMKIARAHKDKDAVAYAKFNAKRKFFKAKLRKKYDREADRQTRLVIARMKKSKSPVIKKLSNKVQ